MTIGGDIDWHIGAIGWARELKKWFKVKIIEVNIDTVRVHWVGFSDDYDILLLKAEVFKKKPKL